MPNRGVNQAVGSPMEWGGSLLFSQEERKSGVNTAPAPNLRIEKKPLACALGLPAREMGSGELNIFVGRPGRGEWGREEVGERNKGIR